MQRICGDHQIADVDSGIQRTGDSGVDHRIHLKEIHQNLSADTGVDLTDAAAYHHSLLSV